MKKKLFGLLIVSLALLSSCGGNNSSDSNASSSSSSEPISSNSESSSISNSESSSTSESSSVEECIHEFGDWVVTTDPGCLTLGEKERTCTKCGYVETEEITALGHDYHISDDEEHYVCSRCGDSIDSGKGDVNVEEKERNYLFLGSSICNGYHGPNILESSMADMFRNDYLSVDYKVYNNELINKENVYMRKVEDVTPNTDGFAGRYSCDYDSVTLNGDGTGTFNGQSFEYVTRGNYIALKKPVGYLYGFNAKFMKGNTVYKFAQNGYTLSDYYPRYSAPNTPIGWRNSYVGLMEDAVKQIKDKHIDRVVIQLSTNDIGQYIDEACTQHLDFGEVLEGKFASKYFNTRTSFGAMEWLIATAIETWHCEVYVFTCHMSTSEFATYKANGYDLDKVQTTYAEMYEMTLKVAEKWKDHGFELINLWANRELNELLHSNPTRYIADILHLTETGYEAGLYQVFRKYFVDKEAK